MKSGFSSLFAAAIVASAIMASAGVAAPQAPTQVPTAAPTTAPQLVQETQLEGVLAKVLSWPKATLVGEPISCTLRLEGVDAATVSLGAPETLGEFDVLSISQARDAGSYFTIDIELTTLASGSVKPAPLQAQWLHDGKEMTGNIEFPTFLVASLLSVKDGEKVDPSQFRDIIGEIDIVGPFNWWPWAAGAVALVAAALAAYFLLRARPKPPIAPDAWALGAFARLEDAALPAKAEYGRYYDELTGIVRHYVAMRYAIPAQQQTSREFMDSTRTHAEFPAQETEPLRNLLRLADQVKFAKAEPTRAECDANLIAARAFVEKTKPAPADPNAKPTQERTDREASKNHEASKAHEASKNREGSKP